MLRRKGTSLASAENSKRLLAFSAFSPVTVQTRLTFFFLLGAIAQSKPGPFYFEVYRSYRTTHHRR